MNIEDQIIKILEEKKPIPGATREEKLGCFYLEAGLVDSMGIVKLIMQLEETFGVQFSTEEMQSFDFQTVGGLAKVIKSIKERA